MNSGSTSTFVISDEESLAGFRRHAADFLGRGSYRHIAVTLPLARRERFEREINARYRVCGCVASAIAVLSATALLILWNVAISEHSSYAWSDIALAVGLVLLVGGAAKVIAVTRAHFALRATLSELATSLSAHNVEQSAS